MEESLLYGDNYFEKGDFIKAFDEYYKIINDNFIKNKFIISEAYNMLGVISLMDTQTNTIDETGVYYFCKAIEYNPGNVSALFNIINSFGESIGDHKDYKLTEKAINRLKILNYNFTEEDKGIIEKKMKIIIKLKSIAT